jgi:DNA-3-methyladenine glycosylase I
MADGVGPVVGEDGVARCPWGAGDPVNLAYHDTEWGMRVEGEAAHFERLTLEAFQSGLSWLTILNKRESFRAAFAGFDADVVATYDDSDVERLMGDAGIVRNRRKIDEELLWSFSPDPGPAPRTAADVPTTSPESIALSKALKKAGFAHVGPTTMYALMEAVGLVDDHLESCHRRGCAGR